MTDRLRTAPGSTSTSTSARPMRGINAKAAALPDLARRIDEQGAAFAYFDGHRASPSAWGAWSSTNKRDLKREVPRAIEWTFERIVIFYIGGAFVLGTGVPHDSALLLGYQKRGPDDSGVGGRDDVLGLYLGVLMFVAVVCGVKWWTSEEMDVVNRVEWGSRIPDVPLRVASSVCTPQGGAL